MRPQIKAAVKSELLHLEKLIDKYRNLDEINLSVLGAVQVSNILESKELIKDAIIFSNSRVIFAAYGHLITAVIPTRN